MASVGHIRDLKKDASGIEIKNDFKPNWIESPDKKDIISGLKKAYKAADDVIIMTDADSEGCAIGYHICEILGINPKTVKRSIALEITSKVVKETIDKPGKLDMNVVDAAIGRRILDRIVGFQISPVLWGKIKMGLSAGRVQSPALRILCTREEEHAKFTAEAEYKTTGTFEIQDKNNKLYNFNAVLNKKFKTKENAENFLNKVIDKTFSVKSLEKKPGKKTAPAPFTTSTLQMEASRKFGMSPQRCMEIAQNLFSTGKISYHRTDSITLSEDALNAAENVINEKFGKEYSNKKQFVSKNKSAEGAHEAIRPTHFEEATINSTTEEQKLYDLIYKRTLASQMQDCRVDNTTVTIETSGINELFIAKGQVITFDGFMKLYTESVEDKDTDEEDDSKSLPDMKKGQSLNCIKIVSGQVYNKPAARYSEASLIKELESLNIGRPSTYASIISVIQKRAYCEKKDLPAKKRNVITLTLQDKVIKEDTKSENYGGDKNKLIPTDTGMIVNKFLCENFPDIVDYAFTANMEKNLDLIAEGKMNRVEMLHNFYNPFSENIKKVQGNTEKAGIRELGIDPISNKKVYAKLGRFGAMIQLGESIKQEKDKSKTDKAKSDVKFASIPEGKSIETITLEEALNLLKWPRLLGEYKSLPVETSEGKFGPYIKHNGQYCSITLSPKDITLEEAIELLKQKESNPAQKPIKEFGDIKVLNGRYGHYIKYKTKNYTVPKDKTPESLTKEDCLEIIGEAKTKPKKKFTKKK
jgi:DNA topoisomerase-1